MESFGNLGYTVGGNIQPGSGTARFGYTPNPVNPPSFPPPVNNRSPYGQTSGWNGWQYNPSTMTPNNSNQGGETFDPNNGNPNTTNNNNANGFSVGFSNQQNPNQNQHTNNMDWRNLQQSGTPPQYQPVTTTGPSSFQFRDPQQMAPSYPYPYNMNSYSNNTNNSKNNRNMPNNASNNMMGHYGQGAASMVPTNPNPFGNTAIPAIIEEKPLQCHVKIGDQGQQPIVYVGGINPNDKNTQNYNNNNNGNNNQVQYNHSAGEPQQQQVSQIQQSQQQQQQQQMQTNHCDTTQMMNQINAQIQNHNQHQQQPQQMGQMSQMVQGQVPNLGQSQSQVQGQSQSQRNMTTPCGCCAACRAQMNNKMIGANQPQIVRGPKVQPRPNMMKTTSAPQMTVTNVENQMMMMQQQQQMPQQNNMSNMNMNGNQGDVNQVPVSVPACQVPQGPIQQYRQPFLS